jgi:hypothetical protein
MIRRRSKVPPKRNENIYERSKRLREAKEEKDQAADFVGDTKAPLVNEIVTKHGWTPHPELHLHTVPSGPGMEPALRIISISKEILDSNTPPTEPVVFDSESTSTREEINKYLFLFTGLIHSNRFKSVSTYKIMNDRYVKRAMLETAASWDLARAGLYRIIVSPGPTPYPQRSFAVIVVTSSSAMSRLRAPSELPILGGHCTVTVLETMLRSFVEVCVQNNFVSPLHYSVLASELRNISLADIAETMQGIIVSKCPKAFTRLVLEDDNVYLLPHEQLPVFSETAVRLAQNAKNPYLELKLCLHHFPMSITITIGPDILGTAMPGLFLRGSQPMNRMPKGTVAPSTTHHQDITEYKKPIFLITDGIALCLIYLVNGDFNPTRMRNTSIKSGGVIVTTLCFARALDIFIEYGGFVDANVLEFVNPRFFPSEAAMASKDFFRSNSIAKAGKIFVITFGVDRFGNIFMASVPSRSRGYQYLTAARTAIQRASVKKYDNDSMLDMAARDFLIRRKGVVRDLTEFDFQVSNISQPVEKRLRQLSLGPGVELHCPGARYEVKYADYVQQLEHSPPKAIKRRNKENESPEYGLKRKKIDDYQKHCQKALLVYLPCEAQT